MDLTDLKGILDRMFIPYRRNPGINVDAIIVLVGLIVWAICAIGEGYGFARMPMYVQNVAPVLFGFGAGRASIPKSGSGHRREEEKKEP
ncbi:MAG: hypothetical protein Q8O76_14080 [Chloroflexota bacterium]|nr:hypothetical protein [Chloroflexota bacterium]